MKKTEEITENKTIIWDFDRLVLGTDIMYSCLIKLPDCGTCSCCWGYNESGYEHVSISPRKQDRLPSWDDMAKLKDIFFYDNEEAYQIMPKKSEYVNLQENCLHLWRPCNGKELRELTN